MPSAPNDEVGTRLRGASVDVDVRKAAVVAVCVCVVALAAIVVGLFIAGIDKNARIANLRLHGVGVEATVTQCRGLLGGSGSNAAGYVCDGSYGIGGRRYAALLPGNVLRVPGTKLPGIAVPGNPPTFSTATSLAGERASSRVYLLPTILLVALALIVGAWLFRLRSSGAVLADRSRPRRGAAG